MKGPRGRHKSNTLKSNDTHAVAERVMSLLDEAEKDYLESVVKESSSRSDKKLSPKDVIQGLVDATVAVRVSSDNEQSQEELVQRVLETCRLNVDRRRYPRIKKNLLVRFRDMDSLADYDHSRTIELSQGGFRVDIRNKKVLPRVGEAMEFQIQDENELLEPIRAIGKIVWVKDKRSRFEYEVGVSLTHLDKEHAKRFYDCLSTRPKS